MIDVSNRNREIGCQQIDSSTNGQVGMLAALLVECCTLGW